MRNYLFIFSFLCFLARFVSSDCAATPFNAAVSIVGYECIGPNSLYVDDSAGVLLAACFWGYYSSSSYYQEKNWNVIMVDGSTITNIATSSQCYEPTSVYANSEFYFAACSGGDVISIDKSTFTIATVVSAANCPYPYDLYAVGNELFVACYGGSLISVSLLDNSITTLADSSVCSNPYSVYVRSGIVYSSCATGGPNGAGQIISVTGSVVATQLDQGYCNQPTGVIATSTGKLFAACSDGASGVLEISGSTVTTVISADVCTYPSSISVDKNDIVQIPCEWQDTMYIAGDIIDVAVPNSECNPYYTSVSASTGNLYIVCMATPDQIVVATPCA